MQFQLNPHLSFRISGKKVIIQLAFENRVVTASRHLVKFLNYFKSPATKNDFISATDAGGDVFDFLSGHNIIIPSTALVDLSKGICAIDSIHCFNRALLYDLKTIKKGHVLFGIPVDFTGHNTATRNGPFHIRTAIRNKINVSRDELENNYLLDLDYRRKLSFKNLNTFDIGDIAHYPNYDSIDALEKRVNYVMDAVAKNGNFPIILGGDHAISYFPINYFASAHKEFGIIQFDAHSDFYISPNKYYNDLNHANIFERVSRHASLKEVIQVGLRTISDIPPGLTLSAHPKLKYLSSRELTYGGQKKLGELLKKDLPYYLSIDADVLHPNLIPEEVGTPVIGGIDYYTLTDTISFVCENYNLLGMDIVEITEGRNKFNYAAQVASRIILNTIMVRSASEPLNGYVYETCK